MLINMIMAYARSFGEREEGQGLVEYALILSLVSLVAVAGLTAIGLSVNNLLTSLAGQI
jgi:pilus assembly protein Flp/PilA